MLDRYIAWFNVRLVNGRTLRIFCLHMPPARFNELQPTMADSLVTFVQQSFHPVVVGGDRNYTVTNDPYDIQGRASIRPRGRGIDGFYFNESVVNFGSTSRPTAVNINSDHSPVLMNATVNGVDSAVADWSVY